MKKKKKKNEKHWHRCEECGTLWECDGEGCDNFREEDCPCTFGMYEENGLPKRERLFRKWIRGYM